MYNDRSGALLVDASAFIGAVWYRATDWDPERLGGAEKNQDQIQKNSAYQLCASGWPEVRRASGFSLFLTVGGNFMVGFSVPCELIVVVRFSLPIWSLLSLIGHSTTADGQTLNHYRLVEVPRKM